MDDISESVKELYKDAMYYNLIHNGYSDYQAKTIMIKKKVIN